MDTSAQFHKWKLITHQQSANPYKKYSCARGNLGWNSNIARYAHIFAELVLRVGLTGAVWGV